jgi:glycosyltransferase involved in cell wall biosynthesis
MSKKLLFLSAFSRDHALVSPSYFEVFKEEDFKVQSFRLEKQVGLKNKIKYIASLYSAFKKFRPDFVFVNDEFFSKNVLLVSLLKTIFFKKTKIISFIAERYIPQNSFLNAIKLDFLLKNIDFLFCRNKKELENIKKRKPFSNYKNLYQIYWGYPRSVYFPLGQSREDVCENLEILKNNYSKIKDKFVLGFIGRIIPEKGLLYLLKCLPLLPDKFAVVFAGRVIKNDYYKEIEKFIEDNNLKERVVYLGYVDSEHLKYVYNIFDLAVTPTTQEFDKDCIELFGAVLAEAMLSKVMVIGSDNGAIPEVINRKEMIFKESDSKDLLRVINFVHNLNPAEKKAIIEENYKRAIDNFSSEAFVRGIINTISK